MSKLGQRFRYRTLLLAKDLVTGIFVLGLLLLFWHLAREGTKFLVELSPLDLEWFAPSWQRTVLGVGVLLASILLLGRIVQALFGRHLATTPGFRRLARSGERLATEISPTASQGYKVVLVSFAPDGSRKLAILTSVLEDAETGRKLATVFVPSTPNVRVGETRVLDMDHVTMTTWTVSEAMAFLMSGGTVTPSKIHFDKGAPE